MNEKLPPLPSPVAWTLTETLTRGKTTTNGYLWFSDPVNCSWTRLYTAEQVEAIRREAVILCARVAEQAWLSDNSAVPTSGARAIRALLAAPDSRGQSEPARSNEHAHPVIGVVLPSQSVRIGGEGEKE